MDTATQALLGAVVGQATFSHRLGGRAMAFGAVGGLLPVLDVVAMVTHGPFGEFVHHRGFTHALWFGPVAGPVFGWATWRYYRWRGKTAPGQPGDRKLLPAWMGLFILAILTHPEQVGFGARRITVSTVGIPERIRELGTLFPQVKLALSLHAARDELRDRIIPLNRKYGLKALLAATGEHAQTTGRKVTFEYVVLPGVNDSERDAREVSLLVRGIPSGINLIGFNPFPGAPYTRPSVKRLLCFRQWLGRTYRGSITIRRSRGEDIEGACGQLSLSRDGADSLERPRKGPSEGA